MPILDCTLHPALAATLELPWSTAIVVIVLLLIMATLLLVAYTRRGIDDALKLWGGIGTFISAALGALLGVTIGEHSAEGEIESAHAAVRVHEARVEKEQERVKLVSAELEHASENYKDVRKRLVKAEVALFASRIPAGERPSSLPRIYEFSTLPLPKSKIPLTLDFDKSEKFWENFDEKELKEAMQRGLREIRRAPNK